MCKIYILKPGQMPKKADLTNAVYNNWHSYGLVTKVDGKLDIKKETPKSGEVDPEVVWKLLEDDIEYERFLHLRHNTAGATSDENCHPFEIFYSKKRHVVFMHNGTLTSYKSKMYTQNGAAVDDPDGPSDTKNFVDHILLPLFSKFTGEDGPGDILDPTIRAITLRFWESGNRGLFISSNQEEFLMGEWKKDKAEDGSEYLTSNDLYHDKVIRGPEFERRKKKLEEKLKDRKSKGSSFRPISDLKDFAFGSRQKLGDLSQSPINILNDWDIYSREGAISLGYATADELREIYSDEKTCLFLMDWIFTDYAALYDEHEKLQKKLISAQNHIAGMKEELKKAS